VTSPPLNEVLSTVERWLSEEECVAVATVTRTVGSSPRPIGARMAVTASEKMVGSVSGGCVEGAVSEEALEVIRTGKPTLLTFGVADEEAWAVGLSCGGTIEVFVEPVRDTAEASGADPTFGDFVDAIRGGRPAVLATRVEGDARVGARMLVDPAGESKGSLGDAEFDRRMMEQALELLHGGRSEVIESNGEMIFFEVHHPAPRLVIVGAVHIAVTLGRIARELGFRVVVTDARDRFATSDRFPDVDELVLGWPNEVLPKLELDAYSYVVVITHDAKFDNPALLTALQSPAPYVGALGSKRTHARRVQALRESGLAEELIERIHAPIGLDIGARTPQEIALATMAEIVAVRNGALTLPRSRASISG